MRNNPPNNDFDRGTILKSLADLEPAAARLSNVLDELDCIYREVAKCSELAIPESYASFMRKANEEIRAAASSVRSAESIIGQGVTDAVMGKISTLYGPPRG